MEYPRKRPRYNDSSYSYHLLYTTCEYGSISYIESLRCIGILRFSACFHPLLSSLDSIPCLLPSMLSFIQHLLLCTLAGVDRLGVRGSPLVPFIIIIHLCIHPFVPFVSYEPGVHPLHRHERIDHDRSKEKSFIHFLDKRITRLCFCTLQLESPSPGTTTKFDPQRLSQSAKTLVVVKSFKILIVTKS